MPNPDSQHLQCMEIWGGSTSVDRAVEMAGLDAWVYSKPYTSPKENAPSLPGAPLAGGDVYYASSCATGRIHRLLLADVAGHGNAVADTASQLRSLMRRYVNHIDQKQFVRSMNQQFARDSADGCFATALVATFFSPNRMLSVCNAGHPRPIIYRPAQKRWALLEQFEQPDKRPRNIPLGILDLADYEQFDTRLEIGDLVVCYTDALIEAKNAAGDFLGEQGLLDLFNRLPITPPREFITSLLAEIDSLHPGNLDADDVTVLLLRPSLTTGRVGVRDKLLAMTTMLKEMAAGTAALPDFKLANIGGAIIPALSRRWRGSRHKTAATPPPENSR